MAYYDNYNSNRGGSNYQNNRGGGNFNRNGAGGYNDGPARIKQGMALPADYVDKAEQIMAEGVGKLTTSKIRNILSMVSDLYNDLLLTEGTALNENAKQRINNIRVRLAYEYGRDKDVQPFLDKTKLIEYVKGIKTKEDFMNFEKYMEALVAYHRFYGGKD